MSEWKPIETEEQAWERRRAVAMYALGDEEGDAWHKRERAWIESIGTKNELPARKIVYVTPPKPTLFERFCSFLSLPTPPKEGE